MPARSNGSLTFSTARWARTRLAVAKLIAGRPKDVDFVRILVEDRLIDPQVVRTGLESIYDERAARAIERVDAMSVSGLPDADRKAWHRRRRQALRDRLRETDETSPAEVLLEIVDARTDDA